MPCLSNSFRRRRSFRTRVRGLTGLTGAGWGSPRYTGSMMFLLVIVRQRAGFVLSHPPGFSRRDHQDSPLILPVPRPQIRHSYGLTVSSACDNLDCRADQPYFHTDPCAPARRGTLLPAASTLVSRFRGRASRRVSMRHAECVRHALRRDATLTQEDLWTL